jgi:HNH endonuclease
VPHVLGTAGETLDLGRVVRLFTRAQRRVLLRRDRGCTYPGCGAPAAWTQAHHVVHWLDGGASDIDNAALLCQRHHTVVHDRRYIAHVRDTPDEQGRFVVWDRTHGSYDRHLQRLKAEQSVADPRPLTPDRVAELLAAIHADDPDDPGGRYWAKVELDHHHHEHEQWRQSLDWAERDDPCTAEHRAEGDGPCHHQQWARQGTRIPLPQ